MLLIPLSSFCLPSFLPYSIFNIISHLFTPFL
jgi:hypothetical protein